jgi:shikimate dehydrogenase
VSGRDRFSDEANRPERSELPLRVGVIGFPVAHSLSPAMQQTAFDALGILARYELWPTPTDQLKQRVDMIRQDRYLGANVTVPHKQAVIAYLDDVSPVAARAGAVNTIVNELGRLAGHNTDVAGLVESLRRHATDLESGGAVVLGAGGAARAAVLAFEALGVAAISVLNRSPDRAHALASDLWPTRIDVFDTSSPERFRVLGEARVIVHATPLGWNPGEIPLSPDEIAALDGSSLLVDLTYRETDLLQRCRERGIKAVDGLEMLVFQGARAFELWTGQGAPVDLMMGAAVAARASRP